LQAKKGEPFVKVTNVEIKAIRSNSIPKSNDYISLTPTLDDSEPFDENQLLFTLSDSVKAEEQIIEIDLDITINNRHYLETKTILIQRSGGENAIHLELTNDSYNINLAQKSYENVSKAILFSGSVPFESGVTYESSRAEEEFDKVTIDADGVISISNPDTTNSNPISVTITAQYNSTPIEKVFTITKNA
jgi:hypothetical protein